MPTVRSFIELALKEAGVLGVGQTPLAQDTNDTFVLLQRMIAQWQRRRWLVPGLTEVIKLGNNQKSNTIGPGQYYNCPRPDKIEAGWFVQVNTGQNPVSIPLTQIFSYQDYSRIAIKELNSFPQSFFYDAHFPYGNIFIWPIPSAIYQIHLLIKEIIGFATGLLAGETLTAGAAYTNGNYVNVPLTGGTGTGAQANISVVGNVITSVVVILPGSNYVIGDVLSAAAADIGGTGAGFTWQVDSLQGTVDSDFNMPPEYDEALHYNLAIRLCSMYKRPASKETLGLAKSSLNTIRNANTQISTLRIPANITGGYKGFNIYNPDYNGY